MEILKGNIDKFFELSPIEYHQLDDEEKKEYLILINGLIQKIADRMMKVENPDLNALLLLEIAIKRLCMNYEEYLKAEVAKDDQTLVKLTVHSKRLLADANIAVIQAIRRSGRQA